MTTTEQIVWAHRVDKELTPGGSDAGHDAARLRGSAAGIGRHGAVLDPHVQSDHRRPDDRSAPGGDCQRSFRLHRRGRRRQADVIGREFARLHGIEKPYYATPGDGIFHFYFPEQGLVMPGQFIPGADSHSRAYGAYGAVGIGVGSTTLGFGWSTGYIYFTLAKQRRVVFRGPAAAVGQRQGHRAGAAAALGREAVAGHVGRARRRGQAAADGVSQHDRQHDGGGGSAERHLRAGRDHLRLVSPEGHHRAAVSARSRPARTRATRSTRPST